MHVTNANSNARSDIKLLSGPDLATPFNFLIRTKLWADMLLGSRKDHLEKLPHLPLPSLSSSHTTTTNSVICETEGAADS